MFGALILLVCLIPSNVWASAAFLSALGSNSSSKADADNKKMRDEQSQTKSKNDANEQPPLQKVLMIKKYEKKAAKELERLKERANSVRPVLWSQFGGKDGVNKSWLDMWIKSTRDIFDDTYSKYCKDDKEQQVMEEFQDNPAVLARSYWNETDNAYAFYTNGYYYSDKFGSGFDPSRNPSASGLTKNSYIAELYIDGTFVFKPRNPAQHALALVLERTVAAIDKDKK